MITEGLISPNRYQLKTTISYKTAEELVKLPALEVIQFGDIKPDRKSLDI